LVGREDIAIETRDLSIGYDGKWVLENVNLRIHYGEAVLFIGCNGSGKTTLIRALSTLIPHLYKGSIRGYVRVCGYDPVEEPLKVLKCIGYMGHEPESQILSTDVSTELKLSLLLAGVRDREKMEKRIRESLALVNAVDILGKSTVELSGGETAKLVLAANLVRKPRILLLDEPTAFLDSDSIRVFMETLRILRAYGYTVIIATHRLKQYIGLADRIFLFKDGAVHEVSRESIEYGRIASGESDRVYPVQKAVKPSVRAVDVWFKYPRIERWVLKDINMVLDRNGLVLLMGRNGSGKTTLLKLLSGLYRPVKGKIVVKSRPLYIPQDPRIFFTYENLYMELRARGIDPGSKVIDYMGLRRHLYTPVHRLSYGQMRKASLVIGLLGDYNPIYLDEPSAGIDHESLYELILILRSISRSRCLVIASHDEELIANIGGQAIAKYVLENGSLGVLNA